MRKKASGASPGFKNDRTYRPQLTQSIQYNASLPSDEERYPLSLYNHHWFSQYLSGKWGKTLILTKKISHFENGLKLQTEVDSNYIKVYYVFAKIYYKEKWRGEKDNV